MDDQDIEKQYHPENFEPMDIEENQSPFDLDLEKMVGLDVLTNEGFPREVAEEMIGALNG